MGSALKGQKIKEWRKQAGLKQIELAQLVKVTQQDISRAEINFMVSEELQDYILSEIAKI